MANMVALEKENRLSILVWRKKERLGFMLNDIMAFEIVAPTALVFGFLLQTALLLK